MPKFTVSWSASGTALIEADDEAAASQKLEEMTLGDLEAAQRADANDFEFDRTEMQRYREEGEA